MARTLEQIKDAVPGNRTIGDLIDNILGSGASSSGSSSTADSKAVSAGLEASIADSKAVSAESEAESMAASGAYGFRKPYFQASPPITLKTGDTLQAFASIDSVITYSIFGMYWSTIAGTESYDLLAQGQISNPAGIILSAVGANTSAFISSIMLANTDSVNDIDVILYANGSAPSNQLWGTITIPMGGSAILNEDGIEIYNILGQLVSTSIDPIAQSKADSAGLEASGADSKAVSAESECESLNVSQSILISVAQSGVVLDSQSASTADSKAESGGGGGTSFGFRKPYWQS